jgi:hypothetical protein
MIFNILADKPHAVCIPSPAQSHIKSMLKLSKLLHYKGFHITYVNTEFNHKRLLKSRGPDAMNGLPDFRFESIPDGLPPSNENETQDVAALCEAAKKNLLAPFNDLLDKLNDSASSMLLRRAKFRLLCSSPSLLPASWDLNNFKHSEKKVLHH